MDENHIVVSCIYQLLIIVVYYLNIYYMLIKKFENFNYNNKKDVECQHCLWTWDIEPDDDRPHWCHNCGYDNSDGKFYHEDLKKWKETQTRVNESNIDDIIDINKKFSDYNFNYMWSSVSNMIRHVLDRMNIEIIDDYEGYYRRQFILNNKVIIQILVSPILRIKISKDRGEYKEGMELSIDSNLKEFIKTLGKYYPVASKSFKKMNENNLPFIEEEVSENEVIRTFKQDTDSKEFVWHRDREDRIIETIGSTDWKVQIDNEVPKEINNVFIPKNVYHRVIKGSGDLKVKIKKLK